MCYPSSDKIGLLDHSPEASDGEPGSESSWELSVELEWSWDSENSCSENQPQ
jgi:hypothetical protein